MSSPHAKQPPGKRRWILPFLTGVIAGFVLAILLLGFAVTVILGLTRLWAFPDTSKSREMPRATLRVADDGCGVIRTDFGGDPPDGLQWAVTDEEGFQVLGRNALGETRFRYYQAGDYRVVLEAFDGEKYVTVSNRVEIQCP